ncbi:MAG: hypothetical protein Q9212_002130 [Teloschistes hypoglaucus]
MNTQTEKAAAERQIIENGIPQTSQTCTDQASSSSSVTENTTGTISNPPQDKLLALDHSDKIAYAYLADRYTWHLGNFKYLLQKSLETRAARIDSDDTLYCIRFLLHEPSENGESSGDDGGLDAGIEVNQYCELARNMEAMKAKVEKRIDEELKPELKKLGKCLFGSVVQSFL